MPSSTRTQHFNDPRSLPGLIVHAVLTALLALSFLFVLVIFGASDSFRGTGYMEGLAHYYNADQYALLADSLLHGRLDLDLPVPDELLELDEPYNTQKRIALGSEDVPIFWDHAYYQGKYYSYFGVIPAVLLYAPYQLITGSWLPTPWAIGLLGVLAIIMGSILIRRIANRYFSESATTLSLVACLFILYIGCNFDYLGVVARFYSVPILSSLFFSMLGLWLWMGACSQEDGQLSGIRLALGSTCMALNLGCRPQFMLACFFAFFIFKDEIFKMRMLFSKAGAGKTAAALVPFVVVIAPLLLYNYARFGSLLDFGSNYNLTGFNMTVYYQRWLLTGLLVATYLFAPPSISSAFPYIHPLQIEESDLGWVPLEPFFGGFFLFKPIMLLALAVILARHPLKQRGLFGFALACLAFLLIVVTVDAKVAGLTERYFSDFGMYAVLAACLALFSFQASKTFKDRRARAFGASLVTLAIVTSLVFGSFELISPGRYDSIEQNNPELYAQIENVFGVSS